MDSIVNIRKYLKEKLQKDKKTCHGYKQQQDQVKDLFIRAVKHGESNSALLLSPKNGGKSTLVNSVLLDLFYDPDFVSNVIIVTLNGLIHIDDRIALDSMTSQMNLKDQVQGRVFNSFSENLTFLLSCLKSSSSESKRLIVIIDEFNLFCAHHKQTLLYNLFDVSQAAQTPICVLGTTCRGDVIELLEKRVKSRFSHRQIILQPNTSDFNLYKETFTILLMLPTSQELLQTQPKLPQEVLNKVKLPFLRNLFDPSSYKFSKKCISDWNKQILQLATNEKFADALEVYFESNSSIASLKQLLFQIITKLNDNHTKLEVSDFTKLIDSILFEDDVVKLMTGLSVLEICLLISIKHHCDIYDNDPFNFEIILTRFNKFVIKSTTMKNIERDMALKRFENLKYQEFIVSMGAEGKVQKEYQMYKLNIEPDMIDSAVQKYKNLPTEIEQWAKSSIL